MFTVSDVKITELKDSKYVVPFQVHYKENGKEKTRDLIMRHESVTILIFNTSRKVFVLVKQFRPAVYVNSIPKEERLTIDTDKYPADLGLTLELCGGIVDKDLPLDEIAREEILEECGYDVPVKNMEKILTCRNGVGVNGNRQTMYYTEVTDSMKTHKGGGNDDEDEFIEIVELTLEETKTFLKEDDMNSSQGLLFCLMWFFQNKVKHLT